MREEVRLQSRPDPGGHILGHQRNVEVRLGEVVAIDKEARQVRMADGSTLDYDSLLLATGATHAYFGNDQWADDAPGLKTLDDAIALRRKLLLAFERAEAEPAPPPPGILSGAMLPPELCTLIVVAHCPLPSFGLVAVVEIFL